MLKVCTRPEPIQAITAPKAIMYVGIPILVMKAAAEMEEKVILRMRGSIRTPELIALAPRMDWKYRGRRYICKMKEPPILDVSYFEMRLYTRNSMQWQWQHFVHEEYGMDKRHVPS